jgi:hypothetical protein
LTPSVVTILPITTGFTSKTDAYSPSILLCSNHAIRAISDDPNNRGSRNFARWYICSNQPSPWRSTTYQFSCIIASQWFRNSGKWPRQCINCVRGYHCDGTIHSHSNRAKYRHHLSRGYNVS